MTKENEISNKIWMERYRPKTLDDIVLPDRIYNQLKLFIEKGDIPNLLLYSPGGMGKTSTAKAIINDLGMDYIEINGSIDTSIDTVRDKIIRFSSTNSLISSDKAKCIFVTEADGFSEHAKNAMKNIIEKYSNNVRFIFDTNYVDKLSQPIRSRCVEIDFNFTKEETDSLMKKMLKRCIMILDENQITYDKKDVGVIIKQRFPDMRKIVNDLQKSSVSGTLIPPENTPKQEFDSLINAMREQNFADIRKIVSGLTDTDGVILRMFDNIDDIVSSKEVPQAIMIISDYQNKAMSCISKEINLLAMIIELIRTLKIK